MLKSTLSSFFSYFFHPFHFFSSISFVRPLGAFFSQTNNKLVSLCLLLCKSKNKFLHMHFAFVTELMYFTFWSWYFSNCVSLCMHFTVLTVDFNYLRLVFNRFFTVQTIFNYKFYSESESIFSHLLILYQIKQQQRRNCVDLMILPYSEIII